MFAALTIDDAPPSRLVSSIRAWLSWVRQAVCPGRLELCEKCSRGAADFPHRRGVVFPSKPARNCQPGLPIRHLDRVGAPGRPRDALFPSRGMCYNHRAVDRARKQELVSAGPQPADAVSLETAPPPREAENVAPGADGAVSAESEDASRYCPVCSRRLESRRCKLICPVCGYYMSCADYY
jgi:hypothetical protein